MDRFQGLGCVALPFPLQLQPGNFHDLRLQQSVRHFFHHGQPVFRLRGVLGQSLMGRNGRRDQQQLIQAQYINCSYSRGQMTQLGRVEGSAVNTNFHTGTTLS